MIRKTVHSTSRGPYRSYSSNSVSEAYNAVRECKMSIRGASRYYGVPVTTLIDRVNGRIGVEVIKSGKSPIFSLEQESLLSQHLMTMAEVGYGYSRTETINLATDFAIHLGIRDKNHPLTDRWLYNFLGRWPELKVKVPRSLDISRAKSATRQAIDKYFIELGFIITKYNLHNKPHLIFNIDEKGLNTDHKPPKVVAGKLNKTQAITSGKSKTVTLIGCCNGVGHQVPPYFVFPGERMLPRLLEGSSAGADGTVSSSGWSNSEIFSDYMKKHLFKYLPVRDSDTYILILYDGHKSHVSLSLIEWAKLNNIVLFVLPPHCSHLLQPLDAGCFGPFQMAWNSSCHQHMRESGGRVITRYDVCQLACKIYVQTLTPSNIQSSFRRCGIYPLDSTVINDSIVAPSTTFDHVSTQVTSEKTNGGHATSGQFKPAECFLQERGGKILENVQAFKVRNTLSKVVGGKAITEDTVTEKIKEHINKQTTNKKVNNPVSKSKNHVPQQSTSGTSNSKKTTKYVSPVSSESENSDVEESEKCIICNKFQPADHDKYPYLVIVKWGRCDGCDGWVHLSFCTPVRVLRRGDPFYCPMCTHEQ